MLEIGGSKPMGRFVPKKEEKEDRWVDLGIPEF